MSSRNHRDSICESRCARSVSCCAEHLHASMRYVHRVAPQKQAAIIDVGGGDSALVADLLGKGYLEVTVTAPALRRPIAQGSNVTRQRGVVRRSSPTAFAGGWPVSKAIARRLRP